MYQMNSTTDNMVTDLVFRRAGHSAPPYALDSEGIRMDTSDIIAAVSAAIAALGLALAALQFISGRQRIRTERERLAQQQERLRTAVSAAYVGMESADLIVQRAKEGDATLLELQNIARVLRGSLAVLSRQLDDESNQIAEWKRDAAFQSYRDPATPAGGIASDTGRNP
jgi:uncharacterized protein HemX